MYHSINNMFLKPPPPPPNKPFKAVVLAGWKSFYQEGQKGIIRKMQRRPMKITVKKMEMTFMLNGYVLKICH